MDRVASGVLGADAEKAGVHAVATFDELPDPVRKAAEAEGVRAGDIEAVHYRGRSYIIADMMRNADAVREAVFHELYTHGGLRAKYGNRLGDAMDRIAARVGGVDGILRMARKQDINLSEYERAAADNKLSERDRRLVLMEELLAHMSRTTGTLRRTIEEWLGVLRDWLRKVHQRSLAEYNAADLALVLRQARHAARESRGLPADVPMFSRRAPNDERDLMVHRTPAERTERLKATVDEWRAARDSGDTERARALARELVAAAREDMAAAKARARAPGPVALSPSHRGASCSSGRGRGVWPPRGRIAPKRRDRRGPGASGARWPACIGAHVGSKASTGRRAWHHLRGCDRMGGVVLACATHIPRLRSLPRRQGRIFVGCKDHRARVRHEVSK